MDLALFSFCLPLEPWNSPSGEKAIFPDASLHFMNIVRSFHPLFFSSPSVNLVCRGNNANYIKPTVTYPHTRSGVLISLALCQRQCGLVRLHIVNCAMPDLDGVLRLYQLSNGNIRGWALLMYEQETIFFLAESCYSENPFRLGKYNKR